FLRSDFAPPDTLVAGCGTVSGAGALEQVSRPVPGRGSGPVRADPPRPAPLAVAPRPIPGSFARPGGIQPGVDLERPARLDHVYLAEQARAGIERTTRDLAGPKRRRAGAVAHALDLGAVGLGAGSLPAARPGGRAALVHRLPGRHSNRILHDDRA